MDIYISPNQSLDQVLAENPNPGVTFRYSPGLYTTAGWQWNGLKTARIGQSHIGSGIGKTIIQLVGVTLGTDNGVIFGADWNWVSGFTVSDMTLDLNCSIKATAGVGIWGGDTIKIQRVEFINFGSPISGVECFPCHIFGPSRIPPTTLHDIVIDACIFRNPISGNKDGCSMVAINESQPGLTFSGQNIMVNNCRFYDCRSDFSYMHCIGAPVVQNNIAINSGVFYYSEPHNSPIWSDVGITIQNNVVINGEEFFMSNPGGGGSIAAFIRFKDNVQLTMN